VEKALVDMIAGCLKALERTIADMLIVLIADHKIRSTFDNKTNILIGILIFMRYFSRKIRQQWWGLKTEKLTN
jgi:hypothetical protein